MSQREQNIEDCFADSEPAPFSSGSEDLPPWKLLIVDDAPEVHTATRMVLSKVMFGGRRLEFLSAYSAAEGERLLRNQPDIAVIFLDVVMEHDHAGLDLVQTIRDRLHNHNVRIVLRTGQPGQAPEREVILKYDINDYKHKAELSSEALFTTTIASLRAYRDMLAIAELLATMEQRVAERTADLTAVNAKLAAMNEEKSAILGIAAHDLRNPLNGLLLANEMMLEDPDERLGEAGDQTLQRMTGAIRHMLGIINRLLDINAIESGVFRLQPQLADLTLLVEQLIEQYQERALRKHITLDSELPSNSMHTLDITAFRQILENLISNAIKFSGPHTQVRVTLHQDDQEVRISVSDQGPGFTAADHQQLFSKFARLSAQPTAGEESSGLGLSIVKLLAEAMGGNIHCDSKPGVGTTFQLILPVASY